MKTIICAIFAATILCGCKVKVNTPPTTVEKDTTVVNQPAPEKKVEEKKVENNTTIVNPPASDTEKKTETKTTTESR